MDILSWDEHPLDCDASQEADGHRHAGQSALANHRGHRSRTGAGHSPSDPEEDTAGDVTCSGLLDAPVNGLTGDEASDAAHL